MNTHLDDQGQVSRKESAKIIIGLARKLRNEWGCDFWCCVGDLNSKAVIGEEEAWGVLNSPGSGFVDARRCLDGGVPETEKKGGEGRRDIRLYGDESTFTGFGKHGGGEGLKRIDFVHLGVHDANGNVTGDGDGVEEQGSRIIRGYAVLPNRFDDGIYISDHRAVMVDLMM